MTDRDLMQQALDALKIADELCDGHGVDFKEYGLKVDKDIQRKYKKAITVLRERLAHCDRCGKKLGGEGDIHTCTPDPIGDAQEKLIAELAAQPEQQPVAIDWDTKTDTPIMGYTTPPAAAKQESIAELLKQSRANFDSNFGKFGQGWADWIYSDLLELLTTPPAALVQPEQEPVAIDWDTKTDTPIMGYTTPPAAPEWQPIETAPKDGSSYLIADAVRGFVALHIRGVIHNNPGTSWDWQYGEEATHWMPLPNAPKERK